MNGNNQEPAPRQTPQPAATQAFKCHHCNRMFKTRSALQQHTWASPAHGIRSTDCRRVFKNQQDLDTHLQHSPKHTLPVSSDSSSRSAIVTNSSSSNSGSSRDHRSTRDIVVNRDSKDNAHDKTDEKNKNNRDNGESRTPQVNRTNGADRIPGGNRTDGVNRDVRRPSINVNKGANRDGRTDRVNRDNRTRRANEDNETSGVNGGIIIRDNRHNRNRDNRNSSDNGEPSWSMYPELHDQVADLLVEYDFYLDFHPRDTEHDCSRMYDSSIMGTFKCQNSRCRSKGWTSGSVPITIRQYPWESYNARVYHERCIRCNSISKPELDFTYAQRVADSIKFWRGIRFERKERSETSRAPHEEAYCEGCKVNRCRRSQAHRTPPSTDFVISRRRV